MDKYKLT